MGFVLRILIFFAVLLLLDWYVFQSVKLLTGKLSPAWQAGLRKGWWGLSAAALATVTLGFLYAFQQRRAGNIADPYLNISIGLLIILYVPKLLWAAVLGAEDLWRLAYAGVQKVQGLYANQLPEQPPIAEDQLWLSRRQFFSYTGMVAAAVPMAALIDGVIRNRYNYRIHRQELFFPHLPEAFDGFRLVQLSDVHAGSFTNPEAVRKGVRLALAQEPDAVVFTGDMVNNFAEEFDLYREIFAELPQVPHGAYSILGNHDYGDYVQWETPQQKAANLQRLKDLQTAAGFHLLLNAHRVIERNGQQLAIVGVENWGLPPFPQLGDLNKATHGLPEATFSILLSHDPSHWRAQVLEHPRHFPLTLSGHTHGMQFGVEIGQVKWSPVKWKYPEWAGLYREKDHFLYVNRGFGYLAFPGRVGILPEITCFTLRRGQA